MILVQRFDHNDQTHANIASHLEELRSVGTKYIWVVPIPSPDDPSILFWFVYHEIFEGPSTGG